MSHAQDRPVRVGSGVAPDGPIVVVVSLTEQRRLRVPERYRDRLARPSARGEIAGTETLDRHLHDSPEGHRITTRRSTTTRRCRISSSGSTWDGVALHAGGTSRLSVVARLRALCRHSLPSILLRGIIVRWAMTIVVSRKAARRRFERLASRGRIDARGRGRRARRTRILVCRELTPSRWQPREVDPTVPLSIMMQRTPISAGDRAATTASRSGARASAGRRYPGSSLVYARVHLQRPGDRERNQRAARGRGSCTQVRMAVPHAAR